MFSHYYVVCGHNFGHDNSLIKAMRNAQVYYYSVLDACVEVIEACDLSAEEMDTELAEISAHPDMYVNNDDVEFTVVVTDCDIWEFTTADPINGSPSYKWKGEGKKPEGLVPSTLLHFKLDGKTGLVVRVIKE